ncbi:MAG: PilZ domain-containing protein [Sedimentisphaerales bacterium]|nr:PilZ domain-containing protein [Sedimentisphaerales bacterium]
MKMEIAEFIIELLPKCNKDQVRKIYNRVSDQLHTLDGKVSKSSEELGRQERQEDRFEVDFLGTLTRLTDVRPGERKDYSVTIKDISRSGMCLWVDTNFVPSRVIEVTFSAKGNKIKQSQLEIVRIRRKDTNEGSWLELGCQSISRKEVRRLQLQEESVVKLRNKMMNRGPTTILVVGEQKNTMIKLFSSYVGKQRYNVTFVDNLPQARQAIQRKQPQLVIFNLKEQEYISREFTLFLNSNPSSLATLAIIDKEEARTPLLQAGVDECLSVNNYEDFVFRSIERALLGHAMQNINTDSLHGQVLIFSVQRSRINFISFHLEENGFNVCVANNLNEAKNFAFQDDSFDAVFADYLPGQSDEFAILREIFDNIPVIALCDNFSNGQQAVKDGANNYLCKPLNKEDVIMVIKQFVHPA